MKWSRFFLMVFLSTVKSLMACLNDPRPAATQATASSRCVVCCGRGQDAYGSCSVLLTLFDFCLPLIPALGRPFGSVSQAFLIFRRAAALPIRDPNRII